MANHRSAVTWVAAVGLLAQPACSFVPPAVVHSVHRAAEPSRAPCASPPPDDGRAAGPRRGRYMHSARPVRGRGVCGTKLGAKKGSNLFDEITRSYDLEDRYQGGDSYLSFPDPKNWAKTVKGRTSRETTRFVGVFLTIALVGAIAISPDLADPDKALALLDDPDVIVDDFQDAIKNIVLAVVPGDDLGDATAISLAETSELLLSRLLASRLVLRLSAALGTEFLQLFINLVVNAAGGTSWAAPLNVRQNWKFDGFERKRVRPDEIEEGPLTEGAAKGEWVDYGLAVSPLKPKTVGRVLSVTAATGLRRFGPVDLVAEIIMWLLYANFSDQMDLDATSGAQALLYGAVAGLGAQGYRDTATYLGLADERKERRLKLRSQKQAAKAYLQRAIGGAILFYLYDELIFPTFSSAFENVMEPLAPEANDPFIQFRKGMEPLERSGARKLRPLFFEQTDGIPIKDYLKY